MAPINSTLSIIKVPAAQFFARVPSHLGAGQERLNHSQDGHLFGPLESPSRGPSALWTAPLNTEVLLSPRHWPGHTTWELWAPPPVPQTRRALCGAREAGLGPTPPTHAPAWRWGGDQRRTVSTASMRPSPQPCPLALSVTFNQVLVMSGPAASGRPSPASRNKWFSFEREVIKTHAQRHCQGTED